MKKIKPKNNLVSQKNIKKGNTGITLIALVVTIIILLILAGVSIAMLSGDNSILNQAGNARDMTDERSTAERVKLAYLAAISKETTGTGYGSVDKDKLEAELNKEFKNYTLAGDLSKVTIDGKDYYFNGNVETAGGGGGGLELPKAAGTTPYKPSDSFKQLPGTTLENGLVITDAADPTDTTNPGNEYVWIEVPNKLKDSSVEIGPEYPEGTNSTDYNSIETALHNYANEYRSPEQFRDVYYDGCGLSESDYNTYKNNVLKSIFEYGGFWIGRYKATSMVQVSDGDDVDNIIPLSYQNSRAMCFISCSQAQMIAEKIPNIGNHNSGLLLGIQWDLILKYLKNKGISESDIKFDHSSPWIVQNIYCLAGEEAEWTLECNIFNETNFPCVARSVYGDMGGLHYNAFSRDYFAKSNTANSGANGWYWTSFRVGIY